MAERAEDASLNRFRDILGSVRDILGSVRDILGSVRDILGSVRDILLYGSRACGYADIASDTDLRLILHDRVDLTAVSTAVLNAEPRV